MKNILKQIKQIFSDNKEYFIRCTIMTLIAGLILGISISLVVPASAADEPTESDQVVIPAGTYKWNDQIDLSIDAYQIPLNFTIQSVTLDLNGDSFVFPERIEFDHITITNQAISYVYLVNGVSQASYYIADSYGWDATYYAMISQGFDFPQVRGIGQTITITYDTSVNPDFGSWFFANTTGGDDVDPDPEYTISAGWYLWQEELLGEFIPHTLTFNYRTFQRVDASGIPYYSYWSTMQFDNYVENDSYFSRLYYSSISNGRVLVYDDINGGWVDETYRRFYISSPLTLSAEDYFIFNAYTEYYGDTPPSFSGETVPSVPDPDSNIFTNIIGGVLDALDAFTIFGGFSLLDLLTTLLGGMALVWILKLLAGG